MPAADHADRNAHLNERRVAVGRTRTCRNRHEPSRGDDRRLVHLAATIVSTCLMICGCAPLPERIGHPAQWMPSPNFNERRPAYVVIHHTTNDTAEQALRTLTDPAREVSAHYLVGRDGSIYQLVDERRRAWHAGSSRWGSDPDLNSSSIGIELDNNGREPFAQAQIDALLVLLGDLKARYRIATENFLGHADVSPGRKVDPSALFPWRQLARHGYGLWCDPPVPPSPPLFDVDLALQTLGYDLVRRDAAIRAFKLHYVQTAVDEVMGAGERDLLYCLLEARQRSRSEESR